LRFDLGARKVRVFRQLLTENLLLGLLGSIAALPLSYGVLRLVLVYSNAPAWMSALPDWRVFLFTSAMGFVAGGCELCTAHPGWIAGTRDPAHTVFRPWIWV
jgi:ABC-type antimicrobial peptide transport system permease subunit